jgi:hypothetical protein
VIVCEVAGRAWVTVAEGQDWITKAALLMLRAVYASAVVVRPRRPLLPLPLRVWTEAAFGFSSY